MMPLLLALLTLASPADRATRVDQGILRWADTNDEVALFGVNYYPPFAIDWARLKELGLDHRQVIDQDLDHLQRLGLTCLRLHCWDREISDHEGNLLDNEHLALLDHLIAAAKQRGIYTVLTPIAWWGTANPSPGFSTLYDITRMTGDAGAPRAAQRRYLAQFVQHRNRETQLTYAADPAVLAFEMINEPIYPPQTTDDQVVAYVNALVGAVRDTGCRKPLFFSYFTNRLTAVGRSQADGITFGWYPTGLVSGQTITENCLPSLNDFPAMRTPELAGKVKAVYEFDAADIGGAYHYPAMARAFRSGGAQWACMFQYDAWPLAASNVDWQTHYLSLPYAPGKALAFAIAAEAFRRVPRLQTFGATPAADRFGPFHVSFTEDLSELVTAKEFLHSNDSATAAPDPAALERVWGVGSCPVAQTDGTGAHFLDRLGPGCWRLEVYPDAVWVDDPFGATRLDREVSRLLWTSHKLTLALPDLGPRYSVEPLGATGGQPLAATDGAVVVGPGVYRLRRPGAAPVAADGRFFAPPARRDAPPTLAHQPPPVLVAGEPAVLRATCPDPDARVTLWYRSGDSWTEQPLDHPRLYHYETQVPAAALTGRTLRYALVLDAGGRSWTFPGRTAGAPSPVPPPPAVPLFDAAQLTTVPPAHGSHLTAPATAALVDGALRFTAPAGEPGQEVVAAVRFDVPGAPLPNPLLRLRVRAREMTTSRAEFAFIQDDGRAYGYDVPLSLGWSDVELRPAQLKPLWKTPGGQLDPARLRAVQVCVGSWLLGPAAAKPNGVEVARIELASAEPGWVVPTEPVGPPVPLWQPRSLAEHGQPGHGGARLALVGGPAGEPAVEFASPGFGPPPASTGVGGPVRQPSAAREAALRSCDAVRLTVRGATPAATSFEFVLTESDGSAWGTEIPLTDSWQTITLPLTKLRCFKHWVTVAGRGEAGDHLRPAAVRKWRLTWGAWLNPAHAAEPWGFDVADVALVKQAP